jgi:hypothetical protein
MYDNISLDEVLPIVDEVSKENNVNSLQILRILGVRFNTLDTDA